VDKVLTAQRNCKPIQIQTTKYLNNVTYVEDLSSPILMMKFSDMTGMLGTKYFRQ
jgi:hypothetical protein